MKGTYGGEEKAGKTLGIGSVDPYRGPQHTTTTWLSACDSFMQATSWISILYLLLVNVVDGRRGIRRLWPFVYLH
jgi:hypothetical protein